MTDCNNKFFMEGGDLQNNECCNCEEGCPFNNVVYCNLDGQFHPFHNAFECKYFVRK